MHRHWLWAIPFIFVVAGAICVLFRMWRAAPRLMHPWSGWHMSHMSHMPQWPHAPFGHETAQQILDRRYASGEITKEQHEEMKKHLQQWEDKH